MRAAPEAGVVERLGPALAEGFGVVAASMRYVPEGGGSHHFEVTDTDGGLHFVTVDDLDDKAWLGGSREHVLEGLQRAMATACALRRSAELEFVVAPVAAGDGALVHRLDDRYAVSVFPFLVGVSHPFGPYRDPELRDRALDMVAALHRATPLVEDRAPSHRLGFTGQRDLGAFLADHGRQWRGGPFAASAHRVLAAHADDLTELVTAFERLADRTAAARADVVVTHGEPHPANLMSVNGRVVLIDWDTVGLGPRERDLALIVTGPGDGYDRYERATGRLVDPDVLTLYRVRWYLDDIGSAVRLLRNPHHETADTRRWSDGVALELQQLPAWLAALT